MTAKAVNDVVDSGDTFLVGGQAASGLPYGLDAGILGVVGSVTTGFKVVVDDSIIDPATLATRLRAAVPAAAAGTVGVESSCVSSAAMGSAWRALSARNWNDEASQVTFTMSLNAATEKIDVGLDSNAPAGSAAAMKALAPNVIDILPGFSSPLSRTADTAPHWGGAQIHDDISGCSGGFTVKRADGVIGEVTAGHCNLDEPGANWYSGTNFYGHVTGFNNIFPAYDVMMLIDSTYSGTIYTDGQDAQAARSVVSSGDVTPGQLICQSGSYSLSICSITVRRLDGVECFSGYTTCANSLMVADKSGAAVGQGGDSGGPIYTIASGYTAAAYARGIVVAGGGCDSNKKNCTTLYGERWPNIAAIENVTIVTS